MQTKDYNSEVQNQLKYLHDCNAPKPKKQRLDWFIIVLMRNTDFEWMIKIVSLTPLIYIVIMCSLILHPWFNFSIYLHFWPLFQKEVGGYQLVVVMLYRGPLFLITMMSSILTMMDQMGNYKIKSQEAIFSSSFF